MKYKAVESKGFFLFVSHPCPSVTRRNNWYRYFSVLFQTQIVPVVGSMCLPLPIFTQM